MQSSAKLTIHEGVVPGLEIDLEQNEIIMGRDSACSLVFASPAVSRRHARLFWQNGVYLIEDLGSSNGTFVNGQRLSAAQPLQDGDQLSLGNTIQLSFSAPPPPVAQTLLGTRERTIQVNLAPELAKTMQGEALPELQTMPPQLIVSVAGQEPRTYNLVKERLTIGRAADNDIVITSQIISSQHATLERGASGYSLKLNPSATNPFYYLPLQTAPASYPRGCLRFRPPGSR